MICTAGGIASGIVSCAAGVVTVAFPGGAASASAAVVLSVLDPSNGQTLDTNTWGSMVTVASPGTSIASLTGIGRQIGCRELLLLEGKAYSKNGRLICDKAWRNVADSLP